MFISGEYPDSAGSENPRDEAGDDDSDSEPSPPSHSSSRPSEDALSLSLNGSNYLDMIPSHDDDDGSGGRQRPTAYVWAFFFVMDLVGHVAFTDLRRVTTFL